MFPCVWHCDWEPYWVFECLLLHNRAEDFWDSQSESMEFLRAPPHELEVTLTLTTARKLKWDSKGREGHLRRGGYQWDTSFCSRLQGLSFAFCYATEKARHDFCHATLKKAQVALDSLSKVAGPVGSSPEIKVKVATARPFTLTYVRAEKTNPVPMHSRGCTSGSIPRGLGSPFFLKAFLSLSQDTLLKISFSESGSSEGNSTLVFFYQLKTCWRKLA